MDFQNNKPLQNVISKAYVYVIQTIHEIIKLPITKPQFFHYRFNGSRKGGGGGGGEKNIWGGGGGGGGTMKLLGGRDSFL